MLDRGFCRRRVALVLVAAGVALAGLLPARAAGLPPLSHQGRWLTDRQGRVVILHGSPVGGVQGQAAAGYDTDDARFLADNGFNAMRLSVFDWEPSPGVYDDADLDGFRTFVDELDGAGVYSLLSMQTGLYRGYFPVG